MELHLEQVVPVRPSLRSSSQFSLCPLKWDPLFSDPSNGQLPKASREGAQLQLRERVSCPSKRIRKLLAGTLALTHTANLNSSLFRSLLMWPRAVGPPHSQNTSHIPVAFGLTSQQTLSVPGLLPRVLVFCCLSASGTKKEQTGFGFYTGCSAPGAPEMFGLLSPSPQLTAPTAAPLPPLTSPSVILNCVLGFLALLKSLSCV